jgi:2-keto-4-pentenoate hydratase/2-oxohepta-3-ene-1,7-dioic acid hydratase in catechol pathway
MKYVVWQEGNKERLGWVSEDGIRALPIPLRELLGMEVGELRSLIQNNNGPWIEQRELRYLPCVPKEAKIVCVGLNYRKHAEEAGMAVPQYPVLFNKFSNALAGHEAEISLPGIASEYDYEAELGVVIGKRAKNVSREEALEHVFGYCNVNDISARDLQMRTAQWMLGKSLDGFCPTGPRLVSADEVGDPNQLEIKLYYNGDLRQHSNTSDMIFKVDEIVSYVSQYITLEPGDLIITGTPEGVIAGFPAERKQWMKPGDTVTVEIEKLGRLTNRLKGE